MADPLKVPIDPNGNLSTKTEGTDNWVYTWNAENQLTKVEKNSVEQARFAYDPGGRRIEKVAGGTTTTYTYEAGAIVRETRGGATLRYVHGRGIDEPLFSEDGTAFSYFHADGLGSVVQVTNASGAGVLTRQHDAWGRLEGGADQPGYAFTGREWDPEAGLYYYRTRYYDPKVGRFVSEDPIGLADGANLYRYVRNNPVRFSDPTGLKIWVCNRKAQTTPGGNHAYYWNDRNRTCCGMNGMVGAGSPRNCSEPGPPVDCCKPVEGSDGFEEEVFRCCQGTANAGYWFPGGPWWSGNDCHQAVDDCLTRLRFKNPGAPGGRMGPPCDASTPKMSGGSH